MYLYCLGYVDSGGFPNFHFVLSFSVSRRRLVNGSRERGVGGYIHTAQMAKAWWREWIDIIRFCSMGERAGELANDKSPDTTNTL